MHELYGRSERLARFEDAEEVARVLERLMQKEPALVAVLPRKSGQREDRYRHLLVPSEIIDAVSYTHLDVYKRQSSSLRPALKYSARRSLGA